MKELSADTEIIYGDLLQLQRSKPLEPFAPAIIDYLHALAEELMHSSAAQRFPEVISFAFFCRRSNLAQLKKKYYSGTQKRIGKGIVFHITPSNVPLNFAYSLVSALLSGNCNIVKLPSKRSEPADLICDAITVLSSNKEFYHVSTSLMLVRYDRQSKATERFSAICDARIVWGGDDAIREIGKNPLQQHAAELLFKDKYSICLLNADEYMHESSPEKICQDFYKDTYLFDQNACTSPHLLVWSGTQENIRDAKELFWKHLYTIVKQKYELQPHSAIDKLNAFCLQAMNLEGSKKISMPDNLVWRVELPQLSRGIVEQRGNCGYFIEHETPDVKSIASIFTEKFHTIAYYGFDLQQLEKMFPNSPAFRFVPVGRTSDFSLTWDGYDLVTELSRPC
jgi:hypothetical protein